MKTKREEHTHTHTQKERKKEREREIKRDLQEVWRIAYQRVGNHCEK